MNSKPFLSVLVPMYNVELYLSQCIDSLLKQGLDKSQYEIILMNDGSTDNTLQIAKSYEDNNDNVFLYTQDNAGLCVTRMNLFDKAQGEFVLFVDSDDFMHENVLCHCKETIEKYNLDLLVFNCLLFENGRSERYNFFQDTDSDVCVGEDIFLKHKVNVEIWNKILRRSLLENNLYFGEKSLCEDLYSVSMSVLQAKRAMLISKVGYYYRKVQSSITNNTARTSERLFHHVDFLRFVNDKDKGGSSAYWAYFVNLVVYNIGLVFRMHKLPDEVVQRWFVETRAEIRRFVAKNGFFYSGGLKVFVCAFSTSFYLNSRTWISRKLQKLRG